MSPQPAAVKQAVTERANGLCEYCKSPADYSPQPFSIEHIFPISAGGGSDMDNLAYACQGCTNHKYTKTRGIDPLSNHEVALFHPRQDIWESISVGEMVVWKLLALLLQGEPLCTNSS